MSGCGQNTPGRDGPPGRRRHGGSFFDFSRRPKCGRRGHSEKAAVRRRPVAERDPTDRKKKKKRGVPSGPSSWGKFTGAGRDRHGKNDGLPDFAFHGDICTDWVKSENGDRDPGRGQIASFAPRATLRAFASKVFWRIVREFVHNPMGAP